MSFIICALVWFCYLHFLVVRNLQHKEIHSRKVLHTIDRILNGEWWRHWWHVNNVWCSYLVVHHCIQVTPYVQSGDFDSLKDPRMSGEVSCDELKQYFDIARLCVRRSIDRPEMKEIAHRLTCISMEGTGKAWKIVIYTFEGHVTCLIIVSNFKVPWRFELKR